MAGSFNHVLTPDRKNYMGTDMLENMGDMKEAVDEMAYMLLHVMQDSPSLLKEANERYYQCLRGERPWPEFMYPGIGQAMAEYRVARPPSKAGFDMRMVRCAIDGYVECPAKVPEACICGKMLAAEYRDAMVKKHGKGG
jgi:hypothetical protein